MSEIKFEQATLDRMLAEVGGELSAMLREEQTALAKAAKDDAPSEESEGSSGPAESPPESSSAGPPPGPEASAPPAPAEGSAPPPPEASAPGPEASMPPQADGAAIEPAPTVEQLQAEYAKLDPEALKMHYLACKSALMATMGAAQGAPPQPAAPGPEASAPPAPPPGGAPMAMAEMKGKQVKLSDGSGGEVEKGKMSKSEKEEFDNLKKKVQEQDALFAKQNEALLQLAEVVATPIRKSVKGLSDLWFIDRTEPAPADAKPLTRVEVQAKLRDKVREGKLSKSDKDLVMKYNVGAVGVEKIQHLLADAK